MEAVGYCAFRKSMRDGLYYTWTWDWVKWRLRVYVMSGTVKKWLLTVHLVCLNFQIRCCCCCSNLTSGSQKWYRPSSRFDQDNNDVLHNNFFSIDSLSRKFNNFFFFSRGQRTIKLSEPPRAVTLESWKFIRALHNSLNRPFYKLTVNW